MLHPSLGYGSLVFADDCCIDLSFDSPRFMHITRPVLLMLLAVFSKVTRAFVF